MLFSPVSVARELAQLFLCYLELPFFFLPPRLQCALRPLSGNLLQYLKVRVVPMDWIWAVFFFHFYQASHENVGGHDTG